MKKLLFGTAGTPHSASVRSSVAGIERVAELGLGCMELEFVHGVKMGESTARQVAETAEKSGITLSAHAPYYINLNAHEPDKMRASQKRLLDTARIAALCGAQSVVFHPAFYLGDPPDQVYNAVRNSLEEVLIQLKEEDNHVCLRPELMGKGSEFGSIEEIIRLCNDLGGIAPCVDFAHWHSRDGAQNSYQEFASGLRQIEEGLGRDALDDMHIHLSGIHYGAKGEIKHLNLEEADLQYIELLTALRDADVKGLVICESPSLEADALLLQETYGNLLSSG